jgi:hypothetical protein
MEALQTFASLPHTFPTAVSRRKFTCTEESAVGPMSQRKVYVSICVKENSRLFEEVGCSWNLNIYRLFLRGFYGSRTLQTPLISIYSRGFPLRFTPNTTRDTNVFPSNLHKLPSV